MNTAESPLTGRARLWQNRRVRSLRALSAGVRGFPGLRRAALRIGLPVAVAAALLICYWLTLAPTITDRDSGELATAVHTMGVAHPTGYPLYLMVGKLFDLLPLGESARRTAFFSAVSAAAGGGLLCWILIALTGSGAAGALGGLVLGLNWWVWPQANQVEVYAFHVLLVCLVLTMFVRWLEQRTPRRLSQLAFCCGLALTHHRTSAFFIAPVLVWALIATRPVRVLGLARTVGWGLLPLLLYGWLPYRSAHRPPINWDNTSDHLLYFLGHVAGIQYYSFALADTRANAWVHTLSWLVKLNEQFSIVGLALVLVGMVGMVRSSRYRALGISLTLSFAVVATWAAFYRVPDRDPFYLPALIVVSAWCGAGLAYVLAAVRARRLDPRLARLVPAAAAVAALVFPLNMVVRNWKEADRSEQYQALENVAAAVYGIPSNAVLLLVGDQPNGDYLYYYAGMDRRPAPSVLSLHFMTYPWDMPLLEPKIQAVAIEGLTAAPKGHQQAWLVNAIRERLEPSRPVYTNAWVERAPPGYVLLRDRRLFWLVPPPGIPQVRDTSATDTLVDFPDDSGSLLDLTVPSSLKRGEPFAITADIRWRGIVPPEGELLVVFAHSSVAEDAANNQPQPPGSRLEMVRLAPLLFALTLPASRPGWHYEQTINAILPRRLEPGSYHVFVELVQDRAESPLVPAGIVTVR